MSTDVTVEKIINKLPQRFVAENAQDFEAVFQFILNDDSDFYLDIKNGTCASVLGEHDDPNITLIMDAQTMIDVVNGEIDGLAAFMGGKLRAEGNVLLAPKLSSLFSR